VTYRGFQGLNKKNTTMDPIATTDSVEIVKLSHENLLVGTYFEPALQIVHSNQINGKKTVFVVDTKSSDLV
jgi:hypothetical protein